MSTQLTGKNFQSWADFDLTIDGLTVVVGESNLGKSAIFRALRGLIRNQINAAQVREGGDIMQVTAIIEGHTVTATRKKGAKGSVTYTVDGEEFAKLGGEVPETVRSLNLGEIQIGDVTLDPIFAPQFGGQFLIEEKPAALNAILGAFSSTEKLEAGKRTANGRIAQKNTEAKLLAAETQQTESRIANIDYFTAQSAGIEQTIDELEPVVRRQEDIVEAINTLLVHMVMLDSIQTTLDQLQIPDTDIVAKGIQLVANYDLAIEARRRQGHIELTLTQLVVPDVAPVVCGIKLLASSTVAVSARQVHNRTSATLKKFKVPDAGLVASLLGRVAGLDKLRSATKRHQSITLCLNQIEDVILRWTAIIALHKRNKALIEASAARAAAANSTSQTQIEAIDKITVQIIVVEKTVNGLRKGITHYDALRSSRTAHATAQQKLNEVEAQHTAAVEALAALEAEHRAAELKKAKSSVVLCGKCGDEISTQSAA